ncbi:MAG: hypothetical protein NW200_00670 [Hyphomonadaceae bacterium]|nr:hypothetical protein [Hyphomonadaceae bacterium]
MRFICDAPGGKTWFGMDTEAEAEAESALMNHAVVKFFRRTQEDAAARYAPPPNAAAFERDIGLKAHLARTMPRFLTLRDADGAGLATAMLPPAGVDERGFRTIIVGPDNADPYADHADAIAALGRHLGLSLDPERCYPYQR